MTVAEIGVPILGLRQDPARVPSALRR